MRRCQFFKNAFFNFRKPHDTDEVVELNEMKVPKTELEKSSPSSSSPSSSQTLTEDSEVTTVKEEKDCWYELGHAKIQAIDLLPSGMIKNSSKLRFDVKEISLTEND